MVVYHTQQDAGWYLQGNNKAQLDKLLQQLEKRLRVLAEIIRFVFVNVY